MVVAPVAGDFVTVHDYLSTVHPWLLSKRDDILTAMGLFDDEPLPRETRLMVGYDGGDCLRMYEYAEEIAAKERAAKANRERKT